MERELYMWVYMMARKLGINLLDPLTYFLVWLLPFVIFYLRESWEGPAGNRPKKRIWSTRRKA